jgi:hypothetical protein
MVLGILRETDSERRPIPGALSVSVRGRTMPWYWGQYGGLVPEAQGKPASDGPDRRAYGDAPEETR